MYQPQYFSALLFYFLSSFSTSNAWLFSTTDVNLLSPPPINSGEGLINGKPQPQYSDGTAWPCHGIPVPNDVFRTPFPIRGGRFGWTLTNNTVGSLWDYQYLADTYFGDFSLDNGSYTIASNANSGNSGYGWIDNYPFGDFATGPDCTDPVNVVEVVSGAFGKNDELEWLKEGDIVGMNATVGVRIVLSGPNPLITQALVDDETIEVMYQVRYIVLLRALEKWLADLEMQTVRLHNLHQRRPDERSECRIL